MAANAKLRFRLDLTDCGVFSKKTFNTHSLTWILVNSLKVSTISLFKNEIKNKYKLSAETFSLFVDNAFIHDDEPLDILRDGDIIKVVPYASDECSKVSVCETVKSKKRKSSADITEVPVVSESVAVEEKSRKRSKRLKANIEENSNPEDPLEHASPRKTKNKSSNHEISIIRECHSVSVNTDEGPSKKEPAPEVTVKTEEINVQSSSDSFEEEILPPVEMKKKRKRRKKNHKPKFLTESPDVKPFDSTPIELDCESYKNPDSSSKLKHIRFDDMNSAGLGKYSVDNKEDNAENSKYFTTSASNDFNNVDSTADAPKNSGFFPNTRANRNSTPKSESTQKLNNFLMEMSKTRQIESHLENKSVILLNCENIEPSPGYLNGSLKSTKDPEPSTQNHSISNVKKNWTKLVGPPRVGDIIAYKVLEMSESYCPEVSKFKTAKVEQYDTKDDTLMLEILSQENKKSTCGKFDLSEEESETINLEVHVQLKWLDLIEPMLISSV